MSDDAQITRRGISIGRLLLLVNGFVLLVPVLSVVLLRIYEGHLVRQTEERLIAESTLIGEAWREALFEADPTRSTHARIQPPDSLDALFFPYQPVLPLDPDPVLDPPTALRLAPDRHGPEWTAGVRIKPLLDRAKLVNLSGARVLDPRGCVVASTGKELGHCLTDLPEVRAALAGRYHAVVRPRHSDEPPPPIASISRRGSARVFTAMPLFADGAVIGVVRMSRTSIDPLKALWIHRRTLQWALAGCLLLTLAVSIFFARTITRPVRAITAAAEAIARGEARRPLPGGIVPAELHALSTALDQMTHELRVRADYIAQFAAQTSHELKTPLTGIRGAAELLRDEGDAMPEAQRQRFIANIDAAAARMQRLITRLLHLARIENRARPESRAETRPGPDARGPDARPGPDARGPDARPGPDTRPGPENPDPIPLRPWLQALAARHPDAQIHLTIHGDPALAITPDDLESAVANLLENALRHGHGRPIDLAAAPHADRIAITIRDRGPGISEGNRHRIFERFFTTERDRGGTGLGLAISRAIARARGGDLSFETSEEGTTFRLVL